MSCERAGQAGHTCQTGRETVLIPSDTDSLLRTSAVAKTQLADVPISLCTPIENHTIASSTNASLDEEIHRDIERHIPPTPTAITGALERLPYSSPPVSADASTESTEPNTPVPCSADSDVVCDTRHPSTEPEDIGEHNVASENNGVDRHVDGPITSNNTEQLLDTPTHHTTHATSTVQDSREQAVVEGAARVDPFASIHSIAERPKKIAFTRLTKYQSKRDAAAHLHNMREQLAVSLSAVAEFDNGYLQNHKGEHYSSPPPLSLKRPNAPAHELGRKRSKMADTELADQPDTDSGDP